MVEIKAMGLASDETLKLIWRFDKNALHFVGYGHGYTAIRNILADMWGVVRNGEVIAMMQYRNNASIDWSDLAEEKALGELTLAKEISYIGVLREFAGRGVGTFLVETMTKCMTEGILLVAPAIGSEGFYYSLGMKHHSGGIMYKLMSPIKNN